MPQDKTCEGKHTQLLKVMIRKCLENIFCGSQTDQLASCLRDVPNLRAKTISKLIQVYLNLGLESVMAQVSDWNLDEALDINLEKRKQLIEEQKDMESTVAWRPSGSVVDDIRAHDVEQLQIRRKQVGKLVQLKEEELKVTLARVSKIHNNIAEYQAKLIAANRITKELIHHVDLLRKASSNEYSALVKKNNCITNLRFTN